VKLLTATHAGQGERPGDFCFAVEGELVLAGLVCARDEADPDGGCGCGRAFSGMNSHRATTTAVVRDLDLSVDDLRVAIQAHYAASGVGPDLIGEVDFAELVEETVDILLDLGSGWPEGAVVGRRLDELVAR
jgi:hypothetical protein